MSQWLLVQLAKSLRDARTESLIHDRSLWDGGVHGAMDKAVERVALTLHQYNGNIDEYTFALNAGHSNLERLKQRYGK